MNKFVCACTILAGLQPGYALAKGHHKKRQAKAPDIAAEVAAAPLPPVITLQEVLKLAENSSPRVQSLKAAEDASSAEIGMAKAAMLPQVDLQAIDSLGFPGSTGYLGEGGLMGSPYRSGLAGGFVVQQQIYDFGRTDARVAVAEMGVEARRQHTQEQAQRARADALHIYASCIQQRSQAEFFATLVEETTTVAREVESYVRTGQRTIVDRYLSQAQVEEAKTSAAEANARLTAIERSLALALGMDGKQLRCPSIEQVPAWRTVTNVEEIPYVAAAIAELKTAEARRDAIKAQYMPKINAVGSLGLMERARLVDKLPYAIGIGVSIPLFDGFKNDYELDRSRALIASTQYEVSARKLDISTLNSHYDELISAAQVRLQHLEKEQELAEKAVVTARHRYSAAEGSLTDVREAIRNLARTSSAAISAHAAQFEATSAKAIANAGKLVSLR